MTTASIEDQSKLLELQDLDTKIAQIRHQVQTLRTDPEIAGLEQTLAADRAEADVARGELTDAQKALTASEQEVESVTTRMERNQQRLDSGSGSAKDLTALQHELGTLAERRSDLEDVELEAMEAVETAQQQVDVVVGRVSENESALKSLTDARDAKVAKLKIEFDGIVAQRTALAGEIDAVLVKLYNGIREQQSGVGAAPLNGSRCGGCQLELNPRDLSVIHAAAPTDVVRCEECRRILVRS